MHLTNKRSSVTPAIVHINESFERKISESLHCGNVVRQDLIMILQKYSMHLNELENIMQGQQPSRWLK